MSSPAITKRNTVGKGLRRPTKLAVFSAGGSVGVAGIARRSEYYLSLYIDSGRSPLRLSYWHLFFVEEVEFEEIESDESIIFIVDIVTSAHINF